jgi:hypothetical protein
MMAETLLYSRRKYKKHCENTLTLIINTLLKELFLLITEMPFTGSFPCGSGYYGRNIDFRYPSYVQDTWTYVF